MKILMIAPLYKPSIGGVQKHVREIASGLVKRGVSVTVIAPSHKRNLVRQEVSDGVTIVRMPYSYERSPILTYQWFIENRTRLSRFDLVHIHDPMPMIQWYLPLIILNRIPVYATFHGFERDPIPVHFRIIRKIAKRLAKGTICIGKFIEKMYDIECDYVSIGAIYPDSEFAGEKKGVVFVGRIEEDTGIHEYIQVLSILQNKYGIEEELTICGDGRKRKDIEQEAKNLGVKVEFKGWVKNPQNYVESAKLCFAGGFLSILEAMGQKTPVLSIAKTKLKLEYLKSATSIGAPLFIHTDKEKIAERMLHLLEDEELYERVANRGYEFAKKQTWKKLIDTYIKLWSS